MVVTGADRKLAGAIRLLFFNIRSKTVEVGGFVFSPAVRSPWSQTLASKGFLCSICMQHTAHAHALKSVTDMREGRSTSNPRAALKGEAANPGPMLVFLN